SNISSNLQRPPRPTLFPYTTLFRSCDTFRAAAVEQLTIWSERLGCDIVKAQPGSDPAAVAHDACEKAKARHFDVLIVDTAGVVGDRKSTRLNSSHVAISYAVFCLKK